MKKQTLQQRLTPLALSLYVVIAATHLSGCTTTAPSTQSRDTTFATAATAAVNPNAGVAPGVSPDSEAVTNGQSSTGDTAPAPPESMEIPIPADSLMPLLTAEFALRERQFDVALPLMVEQSLKLNDPELTRRALHLAEFRQRDDAALRLAVRLAEQDTEDAAAAATAMGLLIRAGDTGRALAFAREAKRRGARINAPALLMNFKQLPPEAQAAMTRALIELANDWPDDQDIAVAVALAHRENGNYESGLNALQSVLDENPDEERALVLWTQIKLDLGAEDAFDALERAVTRNPDEESLRLQYARLLAANEDLEGARQQFSELQAQSPRNGDYAFSLALIELEAQQFDIAEAQLTTLLDLEQRIDEAHYYLGRIAQERGDLDLAISRYGVVGPSREFMDATRRAALLALELGDPQRYATVFSNARQINPGQAERLYLLQADMLREWEFLERAIDVLTEALALFPTSMPLQYGRAMTWELLDDIAASERDLRAILEREPDNATTLNALGYTLTVHTQRYAEAARLIEQALQVSPGEPAILDSLGWVYFKLGRFVEATDLLAEAYAKFPDGEVAAHLGEVLWVQQRSDEAIALWQELLAREPDNEHVLNTVKRLGVKLESQTDAN